MSGVEPNEDPSGEGETSAAELLQKVVETPIVTRLRVIRAENVTGFEDNLGKYSQTVYPEGLGGIKFEPREMTQASGTVSGSPSVQLIASGSAGVSAHIHEVNPDSGQAGVKSSNTQKEPTKVKAAASSEKDGKKASSKPSAKKPTAKKASAKKPTAKKASAKKPTAKKASAKKPSAKKASAKKPNTSAKKQPKKKAAAKKK